MCGLSLKHFLVFVLYFCMNRCLAQNETNNETLAVTFQECKINGTTLIGRKTADLDCVICDVDFYFNSEQDRCMPCEGSLTNNEKNILPTCIDSRITTDQVNNTTAVPSTVDEVATAIPTPINTTVVSASTQQATTTQIVDDGQPKVICNEELCDLTLSGSKDALEKMLNATSKIFSQFSSADQLKMIGLSKMMISLGFKNHMQEDFLILMNSANREKVDTNTTCISSNALFVEEYFGSIHKAMTMNDFMLLLPRILNDVQNPECKASEEDEHDHDHEGHGHEEEEETEEKKSSLLVWLIGFVSVFIISVLSVIGVLLVPVMRHSTFYNRLISFLVALAVGTLIGDALLHLLPHATGIHDHEETGHEGHDHGAAEEDEDHFNTMWKGLMAVSGIYIFYLVETGMVIIRDIKHRRKMRNAGDQIAMTKSHNNHSHHHHNDHQQAVAQSPHSVSPLLGDKIEENGHKRQNGEVQKMLEPLKDEADVVLGNHCNNKRHHQSMESMVHEGGPHYHHVQGGTHIHMHEHEVPTTIANLAWMVVMGDGLHNFSDGLAIGAAFTSSIGAGLSTSIAVFCHELPHELGDFAILINAGMTVKQALLYNFLCACLAFVGLVIGLIIGEYTNTYKLWILAFTAGGFLYIALVDMLPQMLVSLRERDATVRFISQNVGLLLGIALMLLIALREHSFEEMFS